MRQHPDPVKPNTIQKTSEQLAETWKGENKNPTPILSWSQFQLYSCSFYFLVFLEVLESVYVAPCIPSLNSEFFKNFLLLPWLNHVRPITELQMLLQSSVVEILSGIEELTRKWWIYNFWWSLFTNFTCWHHRRSVQGIKLFRDGGGECN